MLQTATTIKTLIETDPTATPEERNAILEALRGNKTTRPKLINRKKAAEILDCSTKTVDRYVQRGLIREIRFTKRRIRFDEGEIIRLAREGVVA